MNFNTVIFDMDGLLIDSEPLWMEAATEVFAGYGKRLSAEEYATTTGLRTSEFVNWWLREYKFDTAELEKIGHHIEEAVVDKIQTKARPMTGYSHVIDFFYRKNYKIGLASSSPLSIINTVTKLLGLDGYLQVKSSAEKLPFGKPHPQVYLDCAKELQSQPTECICFEDSINGMIAVKAARMKCVVVPAYHQQKDDRWSLADLKISSLQNFSELHIGLL